MSIQNSSWRNWAAVIALGLGSFTIVTTELTPIGLLTPIGRDLGVSTSKAGLLIAVYAWVAAISALCSAVILARIPRRSVLVVLMTILGASSTVAASTNSFSALMGARLVGALSHGAFWAIIGSVVMQLIPPQRLGLATSIIFGGVSAASVLGVPMINMIGTVDGWREAFACVAALSFVVAALCAITLPALPGQRGIDVAAIRRVLANTRFRRIFSAAVVTIMGHLMAFTYIEPYLQAQPGIGPGGIAPLLFAFGGAGLLANFLTGGLIDRGIKSVLVVALGVAALALGLMCILAGHVEVLGAYLLLVAWGGAIAAVLIGFQTWILREAGDDALPATAIYVSIFNGSIGFGALVGGSVLSIVGLSQIYLIGASAIAASALAIGLLTSPPKIANALE